MNRYEDGSLALNVTPSTDRFVKRRLDAAAGVTDVYVTLLVTY